MAWCGWDDVKTLMPKLRVSETTQPNISDVEQLIESIGVEIRGVLSSKGYAPDSITDANALIALRDINAHGAAALIEKAAFPGNPTGWQEWWRVYQAGLDRIRKGEVYGLDAAHDASAARLPSSRYIEDGGTYNEAGDSVTCAFKMNEVQW